MVGCFAGEMGCDDRVDGLALWRCSRGRRLHTRRVEQGQVTRSGTGYSRCTKGRAGVTGLLSSERTCCYIEYTEVRVGTMLYM